ncbi:hypothetical protein GCM10023094_48910 [Rhodococcus olei]|uniref:Uncharacterized protein n=1 Tax=Rhodococcus olei TaxID=2161675 RepID=A0ABP8PJC7_9NOCA
MIPALFVLYLVVEVAAVVWIGGAIGVGWTILLFLATWAVGLWLVRSQFRRVFDQFRRAGQGTESVGGAVADGALVAAGTGLLIVPGLVTSFLGLLVLTPLTRRVLRPLAVLLGGRRLAVVAATGTAGAGVYARTRRTTVVDGVVVDDVLVEEPVPATPRPGEPLAIEGEVIVPDPGAQYRRPGRAD